MHAINFIRAVICFSWVANGELNTGHETNEFSFWFRYKNQNQKQKQNKKQKQFFPDMSMAQ